jgi:hypothetical protein
MSMTYIHIDAILPPFTGTSAMGRAKSGRRKNVERLLYVMCMTTQEHEGERAGIAPRNVRARDGWNGNDDAIGGEGAPGSGVAVGYQL